MFSQVDYDIGNTPDRIEEVFEYGKKRKKIVGPENVFDFSMGCPTIECPKILNETLIKLLQTENDFTIHGYTFSKGDNELREKIIQNLNETYGTNFTVDNIFITCGATPAITASIRSLVHSPEDEIIFFAPYFPEYIVYSKASPCTVVEIPPDIPNFQINIEKLEKAITKNTKAILINSPNNPSGTVYSPETLQKVSELLKKKEKEFSTHIYIISDEPYRDILFDGIKYPFITNFYDNSIIIYSFSKSCSIPGERVGYFLVSPTAYESKKLYNTIAGAARIMGHVCAPSLMQIALSKIIGNYSNLKEYEENRNILYNGLKELGYEITRPQGSFFMFMKSLEEDSFKFCAKAREFDILLVPSDSFGCTGWARVSFCCKKNMILRSMDSFKKLKEAYN